MSTKYYLSITHRFPLSLLPFSIVSIPKEATPQNQDPKSDGIATNTVGQNILSYAGRRNTSYQQENGSFMSRTHRFSVPRQPEQGDMEHCLPHITKLPNQTLGPFDGAISTRALLEGRQRQATVCGGGLAGCSVKIDDGPVCIMECC